MSKMELEKENLKLRKAILSAISALNWLIPEHGPLRVQGGKVIQELRTVLETARPRD